MVDDVEEMAVKHVPTECRGTQCAAHGVAVLNTRAALGRRTEIARLCSTGIWSVTYNAENRPVLWTCTQSNNQTITNQTILSMSFDRMGRRVCYTHDGNKNVSDEVSFQQARGVPAHYEYAPFGAVTAVVTNNTITAFNVASTNPFRFSSEYADDSLGLVYYNYRHYNPVDGRWACRDAVGESAG